MSSPSTNQVRDFSPPTCAVPKCGNPVTRTTFASCAPGGPRGLCAKHLDALAAMDVARIVEWERGEDRRRAEARARQHTVPHPAERDGIPHPESSEA